MAGHIKLSLVIAGRVDRNNKIRRRKLRPSKPSRKNELWYKNELLKLVKRLQSETEAELIAVLKTAWVQDAFVPDLETIKKALARLMRKFGGIDSYAERLAKLAAQRNLQDTDSKLISAIRNSIGVNITSALAKEGPIRDAVKNAIKANIDLITSIPTKYFEKLEDVIQKNYNSGMRFETIVDKVKEVGAVTESRAKLIARDQTSKMNSDFNRVRQTDLGIDSYIWQTSGDERVRETHADNDGKTFKWDEPPAETGHPGEDIQCRCVAIPVFNMDTMEKELGI